MTTWYKTGTVAVTNGNATVTGTGTAWVSNVRVGDAFHGPDGEIYEITGVVSDTSLTIAKNYAGSTASGQNYSIQPTRGVLREVYDTVSAWLAGQQDYVDGPLSGRFGAGTVSEPGIAFLTDIDTGFHPSASNVIDVVTAGVSRWQWSGNDFLPKTDAASDIGSTTKRLLEGHIDTLFAAVGSAGAPTYTFEGDPDTGMYHPAANTIGWSVGGAEVMRLDSSGLSGLPSVSTDRLPAKLSYIMSDDTAVSVAAPNAAGWIAVLATYGITGLVRFSTGVGECEILAASGLVASSGVLDGTTGTDGNFTISAHTDGNIYFENRINAALSLRIILLF